MNNFSIIYTYKIKKSIFIINILSEKYGSDVLYSIVSQIKKALQNVFELFHYHFDAPIDNSQFRVMVVIEELRDCLGKYYKNKISIDSGLLERELNRFESVMFHELLHYFYDRLFPDKVKDALFSLTEGIAYYFECLYYNNELTYFLLQNVQGDNRCLHFACALAKYLYENNKIRMLINNEVKIYNLSKFMEEFISYETSTLNKLIENEIDFILVDHANDDGERAFGFIYRKGFETPLVTNYTPMSVLIDYNMARIKHLFITDEAVDLPANCLLFPLPGCLYEYILILPHNSTTFKFSFFDH